MIVADMTALQLKSTAAAAQPPLAARIVLLQLELPRLKTETYKQKEG